MQALRVSPSAVFVARPPGLTGACPSAMARTMKPMRNRGFAGAPRGVLPSATGLSMCGGCSWLSTAAAIGAALPDTPLTTNLGVVSPVLAHQTLFLFSNIGYFVAGAAILRYRESPKTFMGIALMLIGVASCLFHYFQCVMPVGSPVTTAFCMLDTILACSQFLVFGTMCRRAVLCPTPRFMLGWPLAFLFYSHAGGLYTITHALWHLLTAYLAYGLVEDRDRLLTSPESYPKAFSLPHSLASLKRKAQRVPAMVKMQWMEGKQAVHETWSKVKRSIRAAAS